ncbi:hypothetical protein [Psychromonas ossibalaenae]|uniref:hypothetical protein n=1 Tax=Psychromonas ossibalaenae TaxID=444922 RepID=UPI000361B84A|nr:hypothetical protein [Psychromonas ossibalaenae]
MPLYSLLSELDRKVILFTYEKRDDSKSPMPFGVLNDEYRSFIMTEGEYILWELEKRKLTVAEVVAHSWLVTSKDNISLVFQFQENNHLKISSLFDDEDYDGHWQLEHGILKVRFIYKNHAYDINIIANNNRSIHSALQIIDDARVEILKVVPLSHAKYGKALID